MKAFALLLTSLIVFGWSEEASSQDLFCPQPRVLRYHLMPEAYQPCIGGPICIRYVWRPEYVVREKPLVELLPPIPMQDDGVDMLPAAPRRQLSCGSPNGSHKNVEVPPLAPPSTLRELDGPNFPIPDSSRNTETLTL